MSSTSKFEHFIKNSNRSRTRKSQKPCSANTLRRHYRQRLVRLLALKDCNEPKLPQLMTPPETADEDLFVTTPSSNPICHVSTNRSLLNRLTCSERRARFTNRRTARRLQRTARNANMTGQEQQKPQIQPQSAAYMPTSPHTATVYLAATQMAILDFYNNATITSPKQRQQYCTEYEKYYGEYSSLLQRIGTMHRDYQTLTEEMQRHPEDSVDYDRAKERAVEYYSKNVEEMLQRHRRYYYLHIKMIHILKLIADYDDSLSFGTATARLAAAAADYLQRQKTMPTTVASSGTMRLDHENVDPALQPQPPSVVLSVANLKQHDKRQEEAKHYLELYQQNLNRTAYIEWQRRDNNNNRDADHDESTITDSDTASESDEYNSADYDDDEFRNANLNLRIGEK